MPSFCQSNPLISSEYVIDNWKNPNATVIKAFPTEYPFGIDTLSKYVIGDALEAIVILIDAVAWAGSDSTFLEIASVISLQFQVGLDLDLFAK